MTNTLNTPAEVLEHNYPVRVLRYALRKGSGGRGEFNGGEGIVREIEMLADVQVAMLSDRRKLPPYGLSGGSPGGVGKNTITIKGRVRALPSKFAFYAPAGAVLRIETPGGGGWGRGQRKKNLRGYKKSPKA
jgi:N-methylhydantoinase B